MHESRYSMTHGLVAWRLVGRDYWFVTHLDGSTGVREFDADDMESMGPWVLGWPLYREMAAAYIAARDADPEGPLTPGLAREVWGELNATEKDHYLGLADAALTGLGGLSPDEETPRLLRDLVGLVSTEPCKLDHDGDCQEHLWFRAGECAVARADRMASRLEDREGVTMSDRHRKDEDTSSDDEQDDE